MVEQAKNSAHTALLFLLWSAASDGQIIAQGGLNVRARLRAYIEYLCVPDAFGPQLPVVF